jgi:hypothetical protein
MLSRSQLFGLWQQQHHEIRTECAGDPTLSLPTAGLSTKTFMQEYRYKAYEPGIKEKIVDMAINSSGIRDTARVLNINKNTVIRTLKKSRIASSR